MAQSATKLTGWDQTYDNLCDLIPEGDERGAPEVRVRTEKDVRAGRVSSKEGRVIGFSDDNRTILCWDDDRGKVFGVRAEGSHSLSGLVTAWDGNDESRFEHSWKAWMTLDRVWVYANGR